MVIKETSHCSKIMVVWRILAYARPECEGRDGAIDRSWRFSRTHGGNSKRMVKGYIPRRELELTAKFQEFQPASAL